MKKSSFIWWGFSTAKYSWAAQANLVCFYYSLIMFCSNFHSTYYMHIFNLSFRNKELELTDLCFQIHRTRWDFLQTTSWPSNSENIFSLNSRRIFLKLEVMTVPEKYQIFFNYGHETVILLKFHLLWKSNFEIPIF